MKADKVQRLYNKEYANSYDNKFLHSDLSKPDTEFEIETLRSLLANGGPWLDVACGTGFFLSQFPEIERRGFDLSPAMIEIASERNPGVEIHQQNFLEPVPEWRDKWALVSSMWYAYGLVSSMAEVEKLVENLAAWTAPDGACFVPLCDPVLLAQVPLGYEMKDTGWDGRILVTGIIWSYHEPDGSRHEHMIAPHVSYMVSMFETYFEDVSLVRYPSSRPGLVARKKRSVADVR